MDKFFPDTLIEKKKKRSEKIREYINRTKFNAQQVIDLLSPCMETHLQRKTRNYVWKIKSVVAQFRLGPQEAPENTGKSVQLICIYYLWVVLPPPQILQFHLYAEDFQPGGLCKW